MSFMDLLGSPLVVYDHPTNVDDVHLPQPPIEPPAFPNQNLSVPKDVTAMSGQQVIVADMLCKRGINPLENASVSLPMVPTEGRPEVPSEVGSMVLCEVAMGMGEASTPHTSVPDTRLSRPPAGAGDPPQALSNASWKIWNPGQPVIPPHGLEKLDATQRTARKVASEQRRVKQQAISDVVAELLEEQETRINEIAKAHSILPEKVRLLINGETHYRNKQEESLANALVCIKARQVNTDRPRGQKFQLKELQEMVANNQNMQNLHEDTKQKYLRELKESRNCKAIGVRSTNTVASRDVQATLKKIYGELQALAYCTGIYTCLFVTRGHVYDTHAATWFGTDNIMDFWEDRMKLSPDYIIKQLELWACNEEKNIEACDSLENMQKQAKNGLDSGFVSITKHLRQEKPIHLRFANFKQIKYNFGINYEGWPDGIPFNSPYKIQTIDKIRQHHDYRKQVDARCKAGETVGAPRQGRSDKGKKCKVVNEDGPQVSKKAHRGRVWTTPKSREVIQTSDEDSDGTGDHA
ncbi:hypothetical protein PISMIDRAFT_12899 [Pisolithus microcarpus 441]|uniref:Uncharacterized protein n=1 Tax=Pisolithus microcarpus 441 TaxID=765257 RepID=A0A0C9ZKT7_9AGAM|nr:hypothetical protein PISMIDRAFT_12899 [Pisolithus microcarpus 441]